MNKRGLSKSIINQAVALIKAGDNANHISTVLHMSRDMVYRIAAERNLRLTNGNGRFCGTQHITKTAIETRLARHDRPPPSKTRSIEDIMLGDLEDEDDE